MPRYYSSSFGGSGSKRGRGYAYSSSASSKRSKKSPWEMMKVPQLKKACKERLLPCSGRKSDLVRRLQEYVVTGGGRKPPPSSYAASISATSGSSNNRSVVFGVNGEDDNAEMFEMASKAEMDRKPAVKSDPLSQLSQSSDASGASQLTEEQRERIRANREEALKRRRTSTGSYGMSQDSGVDLRSSQSSTGLSQGSQGSRSKATNPYANSKTWSAPAPKVSPTVYRKRKRQWNDDENDDVLAGLGNLPAGAPPIRVVTSSRLSSQQMVVIRSARPPNSINIEDGNDSSDWMSTVPRKHMVRVK